MLLPMPRTLRIAFATALLIGSLPSIASANLHAPSAPVDRSSPTAPTNPSSPTAPANPSAPSMPDRLCGGPPLYRGEIPQQENPGQVGVDLPFPESGMVPCYLLYGVMGVDAAPDGLRIAPRLPRALPFAEVDGVNWRGRRLSIRVDRRSIRIVRHLSNGAAATRTYRLDSRGSRTLAAKEIP